MADLTPRTRSESFLNGEDLEPITRREHFYAGRENELPEGHQNPETREEWFIQKYREAGDVTVESLSVTENGTYTAPSGKAYSPVSVNVPLPSNAYLLQSIEHEQVATFSDGTDNFLKSLEVAIEPQQEGSGDPSPTNIRPISGWDECKVTVADDVETPTVSNVYTIDLDGTRYGGTLDLVSGELVVDRAYIDMGTIDWVYSENAQVFGSNQFTPYVLTNGKLQSSQYKWNSTTNVSPMNLADGEISASPYFNTQTVMVKDSRYSDATAFKQAMNGVQLVYELETPQTIQLSPTIVKSLQGDNYLFASTGEIERMQYWGEVN